MTRKINDTVETLPDGTQALRVSKPDFRRNVPQVHVGLYGRDHVLRYTGTCVGCGIRCYTYDHDRGGVHGRHSDASLNARDYDKVGPTVPACFECMNDGERANRVLEIAHSRWRDKPPIIEFDLSEFKVPSETFWEAAKLAGDGYDRAELAEKRGWLPVSTWGRDGWDLLEWPYYMAYVRNTEAGFELATNCEGDVDVWRFPTVEARNDAIDKLAFWHWQMKGKDWVSGIYPDEIPDHLRGPFSWDRLEKEKKA